MNIDFTYVKLKRSRTYRRYMYPYNKGVLITPSIVSYSLTFSGSYLEIVVTLSHQERGFFFILPSIYVVSVNIFRSWCNSNNYSTLKPVLSPFAHFICIFTIYILYFSNNPTRN